MSITELPVLPESYPLFDWEDWPASYAALVPGGPTKAFEKKCWNGMVDYVVDLMDASGLEWWNENYGPERIKMLSEGNERLTAYRMNSMLRSVNHVIELPWRWEYDKAFRGYIGRMLFFGSSNVVQDIVYPEYFLELVNHINKVVEILRGTSDMQASADVMQKSFSWQNIRAENKRAGTIILQNRTSRTSLSMAAEPVVLGELTDFPKHRSFASVSGPVWLQGKRIYKYLDLHSGIVVRGSRLWSQPTKVNVDMKSLQYAALEYLQRTLETSAEIWMKSIAAVSIHNSPTVSMYASILTETAAVASLTQRLPVELLPSGIQAFFHIQTPEMEQILPFEIMSVQHPAATRTSATAEKSQSLAIPVAEDAASASVVEAVTVRSVPAEASQLSADRIALDITMDTAAPIHAEAPASMTTEIPVLNYNTAPIFTQAKAATNAACTIYLYRNWEYPQWVDGGLWIRQAHTISQYENGELEVR